jgi:hypothetical protein
LTTTSAKNCGVVLSFWRFGHFFPHLKIGAIEGKAILHEAACGSPVDRPGPGYRALRGLVPRVFPPNTRASNFCCKSRSLFDTIGRPPGTPHARDPEEQHSYRHALTSSIVED